MSPQTGPDLVSAGYPISRPLLALLGGTGNTSQGNVPVFSNLDWGLGNIVDGTAAGGGNVVASPGGQVQSVAVPVLPGTVITKISFVVGNTSAASGNVTNQVAGLYTGTGSAPGTTGAQPTLIAQTASLAATNVASASLLTFTYGTPQTITQAQCPYGFVYASYTVTTGSSTGPSFVSLTAASAGVYQWFTNGPLFLAGTHNSSVASALPTTMSNVTKTSTQVPICLLY